MKLRPYQSQGLDDIRAAIAGRAVERVRPKTGHSGPARRVLYVLSTGGGKTVLYSAMTHGAAHRGKRVLILEHRKELIKQASVALARMGVKHQIIAPTEKIAWIRGEHVAEVGAPWVRNTADVAVASVQTLGRRMQWLEEFKPDLIIVDEAHHSVAGTWGRVIEAAQQSAIVGVTATPCRTNGQGLGDIFQTMVLGPSMGWLISEGYLVPPRVFSPPLSAEDQAQVDAVPIRGGDCDLEKLAEVLDKPTITGRAVEEYAAHCPGAAAIVFCVNRRHANHVAEQFRAAGWRFFVVDGTMADAERNRLIGGLADGSVQGLVSVDLISEGTDIPAATAAFMLRRTQSLGLFLQMCGRVLRPVFAPGFDLETLEGRLDAIAESGKTHGLIFDHVGNVGIMEAGRFVPNHGMPNREHEWSLDGRKRRKRGEKAEPGLAVSQCPNCYHVHESAPTCPECGHVYLGRVRTFAESDHELTEITDSGAVVERVKIGSLRTREALIAAGVGFKRAAIIEAARVEKERLRDEVRRLSREAGIRVDERALRELKPKALQAQIDRLSADLWGGVAASAEAVANG